MVMDGVLDSYADLVPGELNFSGPQELTQYYIKAFDMKKKKVKSRVVVIVSITLGRRLLGRKPMNMLFLVLYGAISQC